MNDEIDTKVKLALYGIIAETARVPDSAEVARATKLNEADVRQAFARLHAKRLLLPEPDDPTRIRMAPPFSGVETAFPVEAKGRRYYANCVWDAYGVAAALHCDAVVPARDAYSSEPLVLEVKDEKPVERSYLAHFAVPAAHWWDNLIFT